MPSVNPISFDTQTSDQQGAGRYLNALREHWLLVTLLVSAAVGAAVLYSATVEKRYEAQTDVLVTPVSASDPTFVGIGLLRESSDQSRSILTAARFVKTPQIADAVLDRLGIEGSREDLLDAVTVTPLGQSNIVTIQGEASSPELAATIANAFAEEMLAQRTARFKEDLELTIERLRARLAATPATDAASIEVTALRQRLGNLSGLVGGDDPTLQVTSAAVAPAVPVWPRPALSIGIALLASLLLGSGLAIALELANPKVTREEELLLEQRLPILARVPRMSKGVVQRYLAGREQLPGDVREAYQPYTRVAKRVFDVLVATVGLLLTAPLLPLLALAVSCTPGPIIFRQLRLGEGGATFTIFKFRTMLQDAEPVGAVWASVGDARITRVGALMRRTRLDELPQLVNVLRGEMSIVGPRPERPEFMQELKEAVPFWSRRHLVKPGITGWAQVHRGYTADADGTAEKLAYDLWYLRHRSLVLDLAICVKTVTTLLTGTGAR